MGKCFRKCKGIGEIAVMEVSPVAGVRTRSRSLSLALASSGKRKRTLSADLRRRCRNPSQARISPDSARIPTDRSPSPDPTTTSLCSSSLVQEPLGSEDLEGLENVDFDLRERRETTPSSVPRSEPDDEMESATRRPEAKFRRRFAAAVMPSMAEIEEFFSAAEKNEKRKFAEKYNFDVEKEVPLEGRYEWMRLK